MSFQSLKFKVFGTQIKNIFLMKSESFLTLLRQQRNYHVQGPLSIFCDFFCVRTPRPRQSAPLPLLQQRGCDQLSADALSAVCPPEAHHCAQSCCWQSGHRQPGPYSQGKQHMSIWKYKYICKQEDQSWHTTAPKVEKYLCFHHW